MKKLLSLFAVLLLSINLVGCQDISNIPESSAVEVENYPVQIGQFSFEKSPKTIISLSPALTEIISELGHEDAIIGRSSYCNYPETITSKTDIGSSADPNIDEIIKLNPEVLVSQSPIAKKDITKIENAGVRVVILSAPRSFAELKQCYIDISALFDGAKNAQETAEKTLLPLTQELTKITPNGTFAYIMTTDLAVATGDRLSGDILSYFGENIAKENQKYIMTKEELLAKQPDVLFLSAPLTTANLPPELAELNAVKNNKIFTIDSSCFERPTNRLLTELVKSISAQLAPAETAPAESTELPAEETTPAQ